VVRAALLIGLLLTFFGCQPRSPASSEVHRCQANISLHRYLVAAGVPPQPQGWGTASSSEISEQRIFDTHQQTALFVEDRDNLIHAVCRKLRAELSATCTVTSFHEGLAFCVAETESPSKATTSPNGTYFKRPSQGRVTLVGAPRPDGCLDVLLAATEWRD
jgi:hypothetical protein